MASRRLRREGKIPAVVYGRGVEPLPLTVDEATFVGLLPETAWHSTLITLRIAGEAGRAARPTVMIKEVQRHLAPRRFLSIDFRRTSMQEKIQTTVPVIHTGESPGLKLGGILEHLVHEVPVECLPADIPDHLEADISLLEIGQSFRVRDLAVPDRVAVLAPEDDVIVLVAPPVTVEEVAPEIPAEEGAILQETEEPERIGEREPETERS